jgi:RNA polymerase sigma-70 factor (ECF subfamily)
MVNDWERILTLYFTITDLKLFNFKDNESAQDEVLLQSFKRTGDTVILGNLFKRYAHLVFGVCMKYLKDPDAAQDMVMQIFEKLIHELKNHEVQNFKSWLYKVSINECLMLLRKNQKQKFVAFDILNDRDDDTVENEPVMHLDGAEQNELQLQQLEEGIKVLNEHQKKCIELFYLHNKSYEEVAMITGYSMLQVKSYIQNGKRNLKIYLEKRDAGR